MLRWLPDALTYARVALTLATYPVTFARMEAPFAVLVLAIVLTDILDGPLARRFGITSRFGANLDSAADFLFYMSLPVWTYVFRPDAVIAILPFAVAFTLAYVAALVFSRIRRGVIGFHNRWTRTTAFFAVVVALWTVLWGLDWWLFGILVALGALDLGQRFIGIARATPAAGGVVAGEE